MLGYFKGIFKLKSTFILLYLSLFSLSLSLVRIAFTRRLMFLFLMWNLLLAFVPWLLTSFLHVRKIKNRLFFSIIIFAWIIFFPNAPYILTDLIHLGKEKSVPIWFDLILLLSYGFAGLLYGFVSLNLIEIRLKEKYKASVCNVLVCVLIYVSCFGIYIGRFLRWNSWNLFTDLDSIFIDVFARVKNPAQHFTTWAFTFLFGTLLNLMYYGFKYANENDLNTV